MKSFETVWARLIMFCCLFSLITCSKPSDPRRIFDVHLHGDKSPQSQVDQLSRNGVYKVAVSTSWDLQQQYADIQNVAIYHGLMLPCPEGRVPYSRQLCFDSGEEWPEPEWVEQQIIDGKINFLGEILAQYHGISASDTLLFPYYRLALKYSLPVGIHTGSAGPDHGCPNFSEELGNPSLLLNALAEFPQLKVWLMHAGGPFLKETIEVMRNHRHVYLDISAINNPDILPPPLFAETLETLIASGLEDRILFGSDNADIATVIQSLEDLPFLTRDQKDKVYFRNAESFFARQ